MWPIATGTWYMVRMSVCLSLCEATARYPAKTAGQIEMQFGIWRGMGHSISRH